MKNSTKDDIIKELLLENIKLKKHREKLKAINLQLKKILLVKLLWIKLNS